MDGNQVATDPSLALELAGASERLEAIDLMVAERCGTSHIQDVVSNLLMILLVLDAGSDVYGAAPSGRSEAIRALVIESLRIAGLAEPGIASGMGAIGDLAAAVGMPELLASIVADQDRGMACTRQPRD